MITLTFKTKFLKVKFVYFYRADPLTDNVMREQLHTFTSTVAAGPTMFYYVGMSSFECS